MIYLFDFVDLIYVVDSVDLVDLADLVDLVGLIDLVHMFDSIYLAYVVDLTDWAPPAPPDLTLSALPNAAFGFHALPSGRRVSISSQCQLVETFRSQAINWSI